MGFKVTLQCFKNLNALKNLLFM